MINSFIGIRPAGHKGHSGQLSPTPDELTYPPIKIRVNRMDSVENESLVRSIFDCCDDRGSLTWSNNQIHSY